MSDVCVIYTFQVDPKLRSEAEEVVRELFEAMAIEEFPTGQVKSYSLLRNANEPGQYIFYEHFTAEGDAAHAKGELLREVGTRLKGLQVGEAQRLLLEPVFAVGAGEALRWPTD
jgi:quinol monooxygenase YgiN